MAILYDDSYFDARNQKTSNAAKAVLEPLTELFHQKAVLDLGCGVGTWARTARELGAGRVCGIDGPWVNTKHLQIRSDEFISHNLNESVPDIDGTFDLTVWLENIEHLEPARGENLVKWVCANSHYVVFSAAIPGQGGVGHCNERWQSYWAALFGQYGFSAYDLIRPRIWSNTNIPYWYKQNIVLYAKGPVSVKGNRVSRVDDLGSLDVVHPQNWDKKREATLGIKDSWKSLVRAVHTRIKK